jgi:hypothetical protein
MVLPLLPIIAGASLLGGGAGIGFGLGKGKKEVATTTYAPTTTTTEAWQYSPVQTYAPTLQYQIHSPEAQQISKKVIETVSKPSQKVMPKVSPQVTGAEAGAGGISTPVIAIAAVAVVAGLFLMKGKKK